MNEENIGSKKYRKVSKRRASDLPSRAP